MKNALILHGKSNNHTGNWFPWVKEELEKKGWKVWVPDLPDSKHPSIIKYNKKIFGNKDWKFNDKSVIVGHSSGAVAILGILQALPENIKIDTAILVGAFEPSKDDPEYPMISNYDKIKAKTKRFIFIHSDNDPYCPLEEAKFLADKLNGKLIIKKGQGHFNLEHGQQYKKFPFLLEFI